MSYRDDFIEELKASGRWESLTNEEQKRIERMDDELVGHMMRHADEEQLRIRQQELDLESEDAETQQQAAFGLMLSGLVVLTEAFNGDLCEVPLSTHRITSLGRSLVRFTEATAAAGFSLQQTLNELSKINLSALLILQKFDELDLSEDGPPQHDDDKE